MNDTPLNLERKKQNMSVQELADKANLPKGTVEKILFGIVKNPRVDTLEAIKGALGMSDSSIPKQTAEAKFIEAYSPYMQEENFNNYLHLYTLMNERQKIFVLGMIVGYLRDQGVNASYI